MSPSDPRDLFAEGARLRALASHLAADGATADDLVQDTWLAAMRSAPAVDRPLGPWLSGVIKNLARRRRRSDARRTDREQVGARDVDVPSAAEIAERLDAQRVLVDVLEGLEEPLKTTLVLRYFEELTSVEIARAQSVPEGTVRWRIQRGLSEMRARLDARFGGSRGAWCALLAPLGTVVHVPPAPPAVSTDGGSLAAAGEGVVAMGAMAKVGAVVAAAVVAGIVWWAIDSESVDAPIGESGALAAEPVALSESAQLTDGGSAPRERRSEQNADVPPASQPAPAMIVDAAKPAASAKKFIVEARFVDAAGVPWKGVRLALAQDDAITAVSGSDGRATLELEHVDDEIPVRHQDFVASRDGCTTRTLGATVRVGETTHLGDVVLAPALALHGRVVDADGRGIAHARVGTSVVDLGDADLEHVRRHGGDHFNVGPRGETDGEGRFDLDGVESGTWRVWAHADGMRFTWSEPFELKASDLYGLELVLEPLRPTDRLTGLVVDGDGAPVPEAWLVFYYETPNEAGSTTKLADEQGRFDHLIARDAVHTVVAHDREARWAIGAVERVPPGTPELVIQLPARRFVEVVVRDAERAPIAGCRFDVSRERPTFERPGGATSIEPGRYRLAIPEFEFSIRVRAEGFTSRVLGPYEPNELSERLDVVLEPVPIVAGVVHAGGKPVAGARVSLHRASNRRLQVDGFTCVMHREPELEVETDSEGRYVLGCELTGEIFVRAQAYGWVVTDAGPIAAPRSETALDLELTHGGAIEGRVFLPDGQNAEGAIVGANHGDGLARTVRAGPGGVYRFDGLTPGKWQIVPRKDEVRPDTKTTSRLSEPAELEWSCEVVAGKTTHHDLDATRK